MFGIPGLNGVSTSGSGLSRGGAGRGNYENIDNAVPHQSVPSPIREVDNNVPPYSDKPY